MKPPIYRAKKIDSDEYVIGYYLIEPKNIFCNEIHFIIDLKLSRIYNHIDQTTLAIHFEDMLDSEGTKIFASLSKNGKGGDRCETDSGARFGIFIYHKYAMSIDIICTKVVREDSEFDQIVPQQYRYRTKVVGIQE